MDKMKSNYKKGDLLFKFEDKDAIYEYVITKVYKNKIDVEKITYFKEPIKYISAKIKFEL
jgi:hypothetical protein